MAVALDDGRMSRIHDLELARQRRLHQTELVKRDEDARKLKLRAITLKDDNATLKESLAQKDSYHRQWIKQRDQLRTELDEARDMIRSHETRAKKQALEMTTLKVEVDSLTTSMQDSGKALQEKFALTRELNRLRPEMEHLQSQLTNHQAVVSEKHDLRRQVDSLEVELENERRARQRGKLKGGDGELQELRSQLQDAEKKVASARKEKDKMKKEHDAAIAEATSRCEQLEEDSSTNAAKLKKSQADLKEVRERLRILQQELEECRAELASAQTSVSTSQAHSVSVPTKAEASAKATGAKKKKAAPAPAEPTRKRRSEDSVIDDVSIGTPGNEGMGRPPKKRGVEPEKSTFSITPFLNRNKGLNDVTLEDTPVVQKASVEDTEGGSAAELKAQAKAPPQKEAASKASKPRGRQPKKTALASTTSSRKNTAASEEAVQASAESSQDADAAERFDDQENAPSPDKRKASQGTKAGPVVNNHESADKPADGKAVEGDKKRKRKLIGVGTTLFDDDDGEVLSRPISNLAGPAKRKPKSQLGGAANGFGAFSPLKRQKRGVNASYLA